MSENELSDDRLREAFLHRPGSEGNGAGCPAIDALRASVRGDLDPSRNEEVILHLGECAACAAAWRFARDVEGEGPVVAPATTHPRRAGPTWMGLAAAAVVVIAAGAAWWFLRAERDLEPGFRTPEAGEIRPLTKDGAVLPRDRVLLRWESGPEGTTYRVEVTDADLEPVAEGTHLDHAEFLVPESALERLPRDAVLFWQVTARMPDGRRLESRSFRVIVGPDSS